MRHQNLEYSCLGTLLHLHSIVAVPCVCLFYLRGSPIDESSYLWFQSFFSFFFSFSVGVYSYSLSSVVIREKGGRSISFYL